MKHDVSTLVLLAEVGSHPTVKRDAKDTREMLMKAYTLQKQVLNKVYSLYTYIIIITDINITLMLLLLLLHATNITTSKSITTHKIISHLSFDPVFTLFFSNLVPRFLLFGHSNSRSHRNRASYISRYMYFNRKCVLGGLYFGHH